MYTTIAWMEPVSTRARTRRSLDSQHGLRTACSLVECWCQSISARHALTWRFLGWKSIVIPRARYCCKLRPILHDWLFCCCGKRCNQDGTLRKSTSAFFLVRERFSPFGGNAHAHQGCGALASQFVPRLAAPFFSGGFASCVKQRFIGCCEALSSFRVLNDTVPCPHRRKTNIPC